LKLRSLVLTLLVGLASPRLAAACGAAYPGGPVMCEFPRASSPAPPIARVSASWAYTSTTMLFGEGRRADLTRHAVFGGVEAPIGKKLSLHVGAGGVAGGELRHGAAIDTIGPGWSGFVGVAGRLVDERDSIPFVQLTGTLSVTHMLTHAGTETPRYTAFDLRAGAIVGKTIGDVLTPYVVGRAFGGPAYWRFDGQDVTGTDLYKYQVGGGLSLALFRRRLDLFAEGVAFGEQGLAAGIGTTFF
jgi:hypothetical protein